MKNLIKVIFLQTLELAFIKLSAPNYNDYRQQLIDQKEDLLKNEEHTDI